MVGICGVAPEYFWNEMTDDECEAIFKALTDKRRETWEQIRVVSYYSTTFAKNPPTITKFMPFEWDKEVAREKMKNAKQPSKERMNQIANIIKNNK